MRKIATGLLIIIAFGLFLCVLMAICCGCKKSPVTSYTNSSPTSVSVKYVFESNSNSRMMYSYTGIGNDTINGSYYSITVSYTEISSAHSLYLNSVAKLVNDINPNDTCKTFIYVNGVIQSPGTMGIQSNYYYSHSQATFNY